MTYILPLLSVLFLIALAIIAYQLHCVLHDLENAREQRYTIYQLLQALYHGNHCEDPTCTFHTEYKAAIIREKGHPHATRTGHTKERDVQRSADSNDLPTPTHQS